jgi:hypothetical protein
MDGKIGIGAPLVGTPFVHVARLAAAGRFLFAGAASTEFECAGEGLGDSGRVVVCCGTAGALSRATKDRRNHDDFFEVRLGDPSKESFAEISDCLRPRSLEDDDFKRTGSKASWKYSWAKACVDVGLFRGSHIRHHVTKLARLAGHCGVCNIVSME